MHMQIYIKLPQKFIQENADTKKVVLLSYLYFHTTIDKEIYTTIDCICNELKLSTKSHGERRNQNIIKDILQEFINEEIISFIPTEYQDNLTTIKNNQLFKLVLNYDAKIFNSSSHYVRIEKIEYDKLITFDSNILMRAFNVFYFLKSYMCLDDNCLHICYPSMKTIQAKCGNSYNTLINILRNLQEHQLLYTYVIPKQYQDNIYENTKRYFDYIFGLNKYSCGQILNEFGIQIK